MINFYIIYYKKQLTFNNLIPNGGFCLFKKTNTSQNEIVKPTFNKN